MDKKNFILGMVCLLIAFSLMVNQEKQVRTALQTRAVAHESAPVASEPAAMEAKQFVEAKPVDKVVAPSFVEKLVSLENAYMRVDFTNCGGAIRSLTLKKYQAEQNQKDAFVFNREASIPALNLDWSVNSSVREYRVSACRNDFIQFVCECEDGTEIIRGYRLPANDADNPYLIEHETAIHWGSHKRDHAYINLGMFVGTVGDRYQEYLNFGAFDGKKAEFVQTRDFEASNGFLGLGRKEARNFVQVQKALYWGSVKNQFFTAILTPREPAIAYYTRPGKACHECGLPSISGQLCFDLSGEKSLLSMSYYVGPKDFLLLNKMGKEQDQVMQFGFFGGISKILLMAMRGIHAYVPNWGWTIILLTFFIKLLMWPLTQAQFRASKRMATFQAPLKEIREKFKSNPQKLQMETMKLFKTHRVNPAMGCLPVFVQIPIFLGLYFMLRTSSEMRFQSFLWIKDLSIADTVAHLGAFPINVLPILMGITMFIQMRLTPTPSVDNMQQKIFMCMPFIFLIFCYQFPAALVLYWTVQNIFTILQQSLTNRYGHAVEPQVALNSKK